MAVFSTGGGKVRRLVNYVGWIQSSGTQYIDTGFKPNQDTRIVIDMDVIAATSQCALFGSRNSGGSGGFAVFTYNNNNGYQDDYASSQAYPVGGTSSGRHTLDKDKNVFSVDGVIVNTSTYASFSGSYSALLLSIKNAGSAMTSLPTSAKLYSCKIYDNGTLVRDYRPCYDPDGVACLYDEVNGVYVYNAGSGTFTAGGVAEENVKYREYIQSSGTQYIDTGFKPNSNTRVTAKFTVESATGWLFGSRDTNSATSPNQFGVFVADSTIFRSDYFGTTTSMTVTSTMGEVVVDKNRNVLSCNDNVTTNTAVTSGECVYSLWIFNLNNVGNTGSFLIGKLHWLKIYDNGTLVRDYRPCVDGTGTACLYDRVSCEYVYNSGTGVFEVAA